jgi:hypothetical protein
MTASKMPPVPPGNRGPQGATDDRAAKDEKLISQENANVDQTGDRANIKQNTSNVQDKR